VWYAYYGDGTEPKVELTLVSLFGGVFGLGLAVGVFIAVGFLCITQVRVAYRNKTGIEEYICAKAEARERQVIMCIFICAR
jgi:hypothetical protein